MDSQDMDDVVISNKKRAREETDEQSASEGSDDSGSDSDSSSNGSDSSGSERDSADGGKNDAAGADENDDDGFVRRKRVGKKPRKQRPAKRKNPAVAKRKPAKSYFETDAEVAGEDEDEEEERTLKGMSRDEYALKVDKRIREENEAIRAKRAGERSAEDIAADIEAKYKAGAYKIGEDEVDTGDLDIAQANLPDMRDPKLWMMRCKEGSEVMILIALLNKYVAKAEAGEQLGIMSAVNTSKGVIFVESYREAQVRQAVAGITDLYGWKPDAIKLVPVNQMTAALYVSASRDTYKRGMFVRFNRGVYKGDLAQVVQVLEGGSKILVKTVPRIDYKAMAASKDKKRSVGRKAGPRPPQRLYVRQEFIDQTGGEGDVINVMKWNNVRYDKIGSNYYSKDEGLLYKEVNVDHVTPHGPAPTMEEVAQFKPKKGADEKDATDKAYNAEEQLLDTLKSAKSASVSEAVFEPGDSVVVVKGDLAGLTGHVVVINAGGTFTLQPSAESSEVLGINEKLEIASDEAVKTFDVGDHVKVLAGMFKGETGTVLATRPASAEGAESNVFVATLLLDSGQKTVDAFVRDLTKTTEVVTSVTSVDGYELHDLVEVKGITENKPDAGCVVQLGQRELTVLLTTNLIARFPIQEVRGKVNYKGATGVAMSQGTPLAVGDVVRVVQGPPGTSNFTGVIKHIYGMRLFLHSYAYPENSGILVVRPQQVILASRKNAGADQKTAVMTTVGRPMARRGVQSDLGKSVIITKGRWKGRLGMIRNETDTHYSVELHQAQQKHVTLLKGECSLVGDAKGGYGLPGMSGAFAGGQTPHIGSATPFVGSQTPAIGGQTPMFGAGGATPGLGGRTPAYGGQGGQTPAYGAGSATPMFGGAGGTTPFFGGAGGTTPFMTQGAGGRTPGNATPGPGSRTPMHPALPAVDIAELIKAAIAATATAAGIQADTDRPWLDKGVKVTIPDGQYKGKSGVVKAVSNKDTIASVQLDRLIQTVNVQIKDLRPVIVREGDFARVLTGKLAGHIMKVVNTVGISEDGKFEDDADVVLEGDGATEVLPPTVVVACQL